MVQRLRYLVSIAVIAGLSLGAGFALLQRPPQAEARAERASSSGAPRTVWARVGSLSELNKNASDVVVAKIVGVGEGRTYLPESDDPGRPVPDLRVRDVKLRVIERVRGTAVPRRAILADYILPDGVPGDPPAAPRIGERYLLFLSKSETLADRWVTWTYDGRIKIVGKDRLKPALSGGISDKVKAMGLKKLKRYASKDG